MTQNGKPNLSVFKGREAKLNRVILLILAQESPLSIRQVCKRVRACKGLHHTRYRVVNRRMKSLENEDFIEIVITKKRPQGFVARLCQPTIKTYVALALEAVDFNTIVQTTNEAKLTTLLAAVMDIAMSL
jgi:hypothetical protein